MTAPRTRLQGFASVVTRWFDPLVRPFAGFLPTFCILTHVGRRSSRVYRTPLNVFRRGDRVVFALTYGSGAEWVRNVLAAGECEIRPVRPDDHDLAVVLTCERPGSIAAPHVAEIDPQQSAVAEGRIETAALVVARHEHVTACRAHHHDAAVGLRGGRIGRIRAAGEIGDDFAARAEGPIEIAVSPPRHRGE